MIPAMTPMTIPAMAPPLRPLFEELDTASPVPELVAEAAVGEEKGLVVVTLLVAVAMVVPPVTRRGATNGCAPKPLLAAAHWPAEAQV